MYVSKLRKDIKDISVTALIDYICTEKSIPVNHFMSRRRFRPLVEARQWVCWAYKRMCSDYDVVKPLKLGQLAEAVGSRNHATTIHSIRNIQNIIDTDFAKQAELTELYNNFIKRYNDNRTEQQH